VSDDGRRPAAVENAVDALEARLGVALTDRALALAAITHKSYVNEHREEAGLQDNERLEFLGDAVIDLAVSHRLMERFPEAREGELSKMRAAVVDEQGLSEMARALDLGELLRLGRGEELTGGREKPSLLADAMEAIVAAVFLQSGLAPVLGIVDRFLVEAFARATAGTLDRDFKTQLQELTQNRLRATPRYRVVAEHGPDHSKTFEVETDLRGEILGRGAGRSKKDAEQAAARLALDHLGRKLGEPLTSGGAGNGRGAAPAAAEPAIPAIPEPPPPAPAEPPPVMVWVEPPSERPLERPDAEPVPAPPRPRSGRAKPAKKAGQPPAPGRPRTRKPAAKPRKGTARAKR
jgi:ribonuclease III